MKKPKNHRIAVFPISPRNRDQGLRRYSPVTCGPSLMHESNIHMVDSQEYRALDTEAVNIMHRILHQSNRWGCVGG